LGKKWVNISLLRSMSNCEIVKKDKEIVNNFWNYSGIYESRRRRIDMEEKWLKEMLEKDKWKFFM